MITVARVLRAHGLRGALRIEILSDNPERFARGSKLLVLGGGEPAWAEVKHFVDQGRYGILKLSGVETVESAQALRGAELAVTREQLPKLPENRYYVFEIIGLEVVDQNDRCLGRVVEIETMPGGDVYRVSGPEGDFYLPAVGDIIQRLDIPGGRIVIEDREGLR